jgi:hypothetical protein
MTTSGITGKKYRGLPIKGTCNGIKFSRQKVFSCDKIKTKWRIKMAWRPNENLIEGELDNTTPGKVVGWMKFFGLNKIVKFNLKGNFHRDIRGAKIKIKGEGINREIREDGRSYMEGFSTSQTGDVGDITAGIPTGKDEDGQLTYDYGKSPYIEWYGKKNGRCVLELDSNQIEVIGTPIPAIESDPIDRNKQHELMMGFMQNLGVGLKVQGFKKL